MPKAIPHTRPSRSQAWSARSLLASVLSHPLMGRLLTAAFRGRIPSVRFPGPRIAVCAPGVSPRLAADIFWGIYESGEIRFLQRHLRSELDVVELGSSLGVVACHIGRMQKPGKKLVCVEANSELVPALRRNVASNLPDRPVIVLNRAIDYNPSRDTVPLVFGNTSLGGRTVGRSVEDAHLLVPTTTLSALLREQEIEGPYALVSDIEGAESGIIRHDAAALARCEQLLIELHDPEDGGGETATSLATALREEYGFELRRRHGAVFLFERVSRIRAAEPGCP